MTKAEKRLDTVVEGGIQDGDPPHSVQEAILFVSIKFYLVRENKKKIKNYRHG